MSKEELCGQLVGYSHCVLSGADRGCRLQHLKRMMHGVLACPGTDGSCRMKHLKLHNHGALQVQNGRLQHCECKEQDVLLSQGTAKGFRPACTATIMGVQPSRGATTASGLPAAPA